MRLVKERDFDERLIMQYLLGELPLQETERLDQLSFTDEEFAVQLQVIENDLVDDYARGDLQGPALEKFTSVYLSSPKRRDKVKFAQALFKIAPPMRPERSRWQSLFAIPTFGWRTALAATTLLLLFTTAWLALENRRLRVDNNAFAIARPAAQEKQPGPDRLPNIVALTLLPPARGVGRLATLVVPAGADFVSLQAELETGDYDEYRAELRSLPRKESVWKSATLQAWQGEGTRVLGITMQADTLQPGTYLLELSGVTANGKQEPLSNYPFKVDRR